MSPTVIDDVDTGSFIGGIDRDLATARVAFGTARAACARCPSGENARLVAEALAAVDRLLDLRLAASG